MSHTITSSSIPISLGRKPQGNSRVQAAIFSVSAETGATSSLRPAQRFRYLGRSIALVSDRRATGSAMTSCGPGPGLLQHIKSGFATIGSALSPASHVADADNVPEGENPGVAAMTLRQTAARSPATPTHLVIMANGLWGQPGNWDVICEQLTQELDMAEVVLHTSKVNTFFTTYDGIDTCGQRLADEIFELTKQYDSLRRITVIGHSMGGLLARYAIGALYDPATRTIAGLTPCHFITIATPHLGCDKEGVAQVPFIGWMGKAGVGIQKVLKDIAVPTAKKLLKRTGLQFFLADLDGGANCLTYAQSPARPCPVPPVATTAASAAVNTPVVFAHAGIGSAIIIPESQPAGASALQSAQAPGRSSKDVAADAATAVKDASAGRRNRDGKEEPLLVTMTGDVPSKGLFFLSALQSFASRTAYANSAGDHLVGWANSSLRFMNQLPPLPRARGARGVVLEDDLMAAFDSKYGPPMPPAPSVATGSSADTPGGKAHNAAAKEEVPGDSLQAVGMLNALQSLPWRRIDVSFKGTWIGFAHNNIQATRRLLNFAGIAVTKHLAQQVSALEARYFELQRGGGVASHPLPCGGSNSTDAGFDADVKEDALPEARSQSREMTRVDAVDKQGQVIKDDDLESNSEEFDSDMVRLDHTKSIEP